MANGRTKSSVGKLGELIDAYCIKNSWSNVRFAEEMGVDPGVTRQWRSKKIPPVIKSFGNMLDLFGMSMEEYDAIPEDALDRSDNVRSAYGIKPPVGKLGELIDDYCIENCRSLKEFANEMGVWRGEVYLWRRGEFLPNVENFSNLLGLLRMSRGEYDAIPEDALDRIAYIRTCEKSAFDDPEKGALEDHEVTSSEYRVGEFDDPEKEALEDYRAAFNDYENV